MRTILLLLLILIDVQLSAQNLNLVPNGGFEEYVVCPDDLRGIGVLGQPERSVLNWFQSHNGTTDYYHTCGGFGWRVPNTLFGYHPPKEGNAFCGIFSFATKDTTRNDYEYREYLNVRLKSPLVAGKTYCVSFYAAIADKALQFNYVLDNSLYFTKALGLALTKEPLIDTSNLTMPAAAPYYRFPIEPQIKARELLTDTAKWYLIHDLYTATGGEEWITIGNFMDDLESLKNSQVYIKGLHEHDGNYWAYVHIDKVSIYATDAMPALFPEPPVVWCSERFPEMMGTLEPLETYQWSTATESPVIEVSGPGTYSVSGILNGCLIQDTITISAEDPLILDLGPDINNCVEGELQSVTLSNKVPLPKYYWTNNHQEPTLTVEKPSTYRLASNNACGFFSDEVTVLGCSSGPLYTPNIFTPESGDENSFFIASGRNYIIDHLQVFDVWGTQVYNEKNPNLGWDGTYKGRLCTPGVYMWVVDYHTWEQPKIIREHGTITLIR